jgi:hypothetical protein
MTPKQVAELLIGIAKTQAAMLSAIEETLEKSSLAPQVKQAAGQKLYALQGGAKRRPITLSTLPAAVLQSALAPNSPAGRTLEKTTLAQVLQLLEQPKP